MGSIESLILYLQYLTLIWAQSLSQSGSDHCYSIPDTKASSFPLLAKLYLMKYLRGSLFGLTKQLWVE